jgi:hypothetical protein
MATNGTPQRGPRLRRRTLRSEEQSACKRFGLAPDSGVPRPRSPVGAVAALRLQTVATASGAAMAHAPQTPQCAERVYQFGLTWDYIGSNLT